MGEGIENYCPCPYSQPQDFACLNIMGGLCFREHKLDAQILLKKSRFERSMIYRAIRQFVLVIAFTFPTNELYKKASLHKLDFINLLIYSLKFYQN